MLFFPVVMNAIQYYIIDSFIKDQEPFEHDAVPSEDADGDEDDDDDEVRDRHSNRDATDEDNHNASAGKTGAEVSISEHKADVPGPGGTSDRTDTPERLHDYDPATDGEGSGSGEYDHTPLLSGEAKSRATSEPAVARI